MGEITTKLQGGWHASKGGVKGCRKLCRPLQSSETCRNACLYQGHVWCECRRACADAACQEREQRAALSQRKVAVDNWAHLCALCNLVCRATLNQYTNQ